MSRLHSFSELLSVLLGTLLACVFFGACFGGGGGHGGGGGGGGGGGQQIQFINLNISASSPSKLTFTDETNASFNVVVTNVGGLPSDQLVTATVSLPQGISFTSYSSTTPGWSCTANASGQTITCTSSASIAGLTGTSTIAINVSVASNTLGLTTMGLSVSTPDGTPATNSFAANVTINSPVPTITSLSPSSVTVGGAAFTLTVKGTNFLSASQVVNGTNYNESSTVQWNGTDITTTVVSSTQLTALIAAGDVASSGTASVTVVNPTAPGVGGGGTSNAMTFTINPLPATALTITQPPYSPVIVATGASVAFIASVASGAAAEGVQWAVNGIAGGNSTLGTISPAQATSGQSVTYMAPTSVPTPNSVSITASATQNSSIVSQTVTVNIVPNNNSLLNGPFAFQLRGYQSSVGPFGAIGTFTADGAGGLSDAYVTSSYEGMNFWEWSGSYAMDSATHGTIQLTDGSNPNGYMSLSIELDQGGQQGFLIETSGAVVVNSSVYAGAVGSGAFQMRTPADFDFGTGHFQGTYLMRLDGVDTSGTTREAIIGLLTVLGDGTISAGEADDSAGNYGQLSGSATLEGYGYPPGSGYAQVSLTTPGGSGFIFLFYFYIVDSGHVLALDLATTESSETVPAVLTGVLLSQQTSSGYSTSNALNGPSVFEALGINSSGHASLIGGTLSVDPANPTTNVAGIYDSNDGGVIPSSAPVIYGGTYTVTSEGRGTLSMTSGGATVLNAVFYLRNPGEGFMLEQPGSGNYEGRTGHIVPQTVPSGGFQDSTFENLTAVGGTETLTVGSTNGVAAVAVSSTSPPTFSAVGDGSLLGIAPVFGASSSGELSITDSARGRGTLAFTSGSFFGSVNPVFYAVDSETIAVIPQDSAVVDPQLILIRP